MIDEIFFPSLAFSLREVPSSPPSFPICYNFCWPPTKVHSSSTTTQQLRKLELKSIMFYNTVRPAIANYYGTFISEYMEKNIACVCTYSANCHLTAEVQKDLNLAYVAIARIFSWPCFEIICLFFNLHVTSLTVTHEGNSFCVYTQDPSRINDRILSHICSFSLANCRCISKL